MFVSYRRADGAAADRVIERLHSRFGGKLVTDVAWLQGGDAFTPRLEQAVRRSAVVVALIGPAWIGTAARLQDDHDPVRGELEAALSARVPIIPVLIEGALRPGDVLPPQVEGLLDRQEVAVRREAFDQDMGHVVAAVERFTPALPLGGWTHLDVIGLASERLPKRQQSGGNLRRVAELVAGVLGREELLDIAPGRAARRPRSMGFVIVTTEGVQLLEIDDRWRPYRQAHVPFVDLRRVELQPGQPHWGQRTGSLELATGVGSVRMTEILWDQAQALERTIREWL